MRNEQNLPLPCRGKPPTTRYSWGHRLAPIDDHGVHTGFCRSGRVGNVNGSLVDGNLYVFCVSGVTCFIHEETYGGYGFHLVAERDTE